MNKISGILPTSARIESLDMRQERPLRSGTVSFGQPVVKPAERIQVAQVEMPGDENFDDLSVGLNKPGRKSDEKIAEDLSAAFFMKRRDASGIGSNPADSIQVEGASGETPRLSIRV